MIPKILSRKFFITLIFLSICKAALSEDISDDHTIISSGTETNQQKFIKNNISLTIKDGATLSVSTKPVHINTKSGATVTVYYNSTTTTYNAPSSAGSLWSVFTFTTGGGLVEVGTMSDQTNPANVY